MIDNKNLVSGTIVKGIGGFYYVRTKDKIVECRARGKFRKDEQSPIVGDNVDVLLSGDGTGQVSKIHERKNFLIRPGVSNVDTLVLVSAAKSPLPDMLLLDKLLVIAESRGIECVICLNKTDLSPEEEIRDISDIYEKAGYRVIVASAKTGEGASELQSIIKGNIVAFAPFGFFLPMFFKIGRNLFGCVFFSALFSLAVEAVQFFTKVGAFDVDDILLNAIGGFVGWLCYFIIWNPLTKKKIKRKKR